MIKFENTDVLGWEHAIRGMRNPMNSHNKSDSHKCDWEDCYMVLNGHEPCQECNYGEYRYCVGCKDMDLMKRLRKAGTDHRKYLRMITVYVDITAPLYWWKEFDQYRIGVTTNSCSTMHTIHKKEFTLDDFSCDKLDDKYHYEITDYYEHCGSYQTTEEHMFNTINMLNGLRNSYLKTKDKNYWYQIIQLLPSSYNQKRTVMMNYEVLNNIYKSRKNHKLDEWSENIAIIDGIEFTNKWLSDNEMYVGFCDWIKTLPYAKELIIGE